jgi:cytochrome P450
MPFTHAPSIGVRLKRELPPSAPLPAALQTLGCRWWPHSYVGQCHDRYGDRFTIYAIDRPPLVFLANPMDIREILAASPAELHPGKGGRTIAPIVGELSFVLLDEDDHSYGRRSITPAFHRRLAQAQTTALSDVVAQEVAAWPRNISFPLHPHIRALTLRVILRVIFSDQDRALEPLHNRVMNMMAIASSMILQLPKISHLPGWHKTWRRFLRQRNEVDELIFGLVEQRRSQPAGQRADLLDMLLVAENPDGSPLSEQQIRDNLMSMIIAGHETTSGELAWAFQLLAHNPRVRDRLIEELDGGAGEEYLTATIYETLRHKPVFLFTIPRAVVREIEIGGWTYRAPAHLLGCTYLMHHDPELHPDPHRFRPERFLRDAPGPPTWLPWGGGRKHCLGRHFALVELRSVIREVLATATVLPASQHIEHARWRGVIVVPHAGGRVILRARHA